MIWPWLMVFLLPFPLLALRSERAYRRLSRLSQVPALPQGLPALFITGALFPALGFLFVPLLGMPPIWISISWTVAAAVFIPWARRAGGVQYACLAPVGALFVQIAAVIGIVRTLTGAGRPWKGRLI